MDAAHVKDKTPLLRFFWWLSAALFALLLVLIWKSEIEHFYVPNLKIPEPNIEQGRNHPADEVLDEIRSHRTASRNWKDDAQIVSAAEKLLRGQAEVQDFEPIEVHLPFDPSDLDRGASVWQLQFAGLVVPEVLLDAYKISGREEFYEMALQVMRAWAKYERNAWLDRGFLWNDHAIADRARTIAEFWRVYRHRKDYRPDIARELWEFASRTAALLAKPDLYNFATNHGVMENIALMHLCIAFPTLPNVADYQRIALSRLKDELGFYVSPEGVILEHSAEYDEYGFFLFGVAMRDAALLHLQVPAEWNTKYEAAERFYLEIRRPDGSLPSFGDTTLGQQFWGTPISEFDDHGNAGPLAPQKKKHAVSPVGFYPAEGYAVLWDDLSDGTPSSSSSETVLAWSYFPGHGHKHADEPSIDLWAKGHAWWSNIGYWPYDDPDRLRAECWEGSNAPHLVGETCSGQRSSRLLSYATADGFFAAEIERRGPGNLAIRRLFIHSSPSVWIIADRSPEGNGANILQTIWTTSPEINLQHSAGSAYQLTAANVPGKLRAYFWGPPAFSQRTLKGSREPFAGWISEMSKPQATQAVVTEQPSKDAWALTAWIWDEQASELGDDLSKVVTWSNGENWRVALHLKSGVETLSRQGATLSVERAGAGNGTAAQQKIELIPPPPKMDAQIAEIHASYAAAAARNPRFKELFFYRLRATYLALIVLFSQELFFFLYRRMRGGRVALLRGFAVCGWIALIVWIPFFYLASA